MKAVIFTRVSTEQQSLDEQERRVMQNALRDGYKASELLFVSAKESASKLTESQRSGLVELKRLITEDPEINAVYVFEISRLARRKDVLFPVLQWLKERNIQIVIDTPYCRMFNPDGTVSDTAELVVTIFAQLAESEMRVKQERFKNGKNLAVKSGKWIWSHTPYGFDKNPDSKKLEVNPEEASIINQAFRLYLDGYGFVNLKKWIHDRGVTFTHSRLKWMLSYELYRGAIVPEEIFDAAQEKRSERRRVAKARKFNLTEQLVVCPVCGKHLQVFTHALQCSYHNHAYKNTKNWCESTLSLSKIYMDNIVYQCAIDYAAKLYQRDRHEHFRVLGERLTALPQLIEGARKNMENLNARFERLAENYENGLLDKKKYESRRRKLKDEFDELEHRIQSLNAEKSNIDAEQELAIVQKPEDLYLFMKVDGETAHFSREELWRFVHQHVGRIEVEQLPTQRRTVMIYVYPKDETLCRKTTYRMSGQGAGFKMEILLFNGHYLDCTKEYKKRDFDRLNWYEPTEKTEKTGNPDEVFEDAPADIADDILNFLEQQ